MLESFSSFVAAKACADNTYDKEVVAYGLEILLSTVINITLLLIMAFVFGYGKELIVFIVFFASLRISAGGFHAKNHIFCLVYYFSISFVGIHIALFIPQQYSLIYASIASIASILLVYILAPTATKNRPVSSSEYIRFRKRSRISIVLLVCIGVLLSITGFWQFGLVGVTAILAESLTLIPKS